MEQRASYRLGLQHGIPTALGYFVVSFTFGMMASIGGVSPWYATLISLTNLTSAGQFAGLNIILHAGTYLELFVSMIVINSRYMLMSTALSQKIEAGTSLLKKMVMAIFITDENFAVAMVEVKSVTFSYYLGVATLPYLGWSSGTLLGALMDSLLTSSMKNAASIALYGMFFALFIPPARENRAVREVVIVAIFVSLGLYYVPLFEVVTDGYKILVAAIIASLYGALRYPVEEV